MLSAKPGSWKRLQDSRERPRTCTSFILRGRPWPMENCKLHRPWGAPLPGWMALSAGLPAARPVGCDPRWGARAARASGRGLVYTMQVISHKSWGGYPGGRMLKILFRDVWQAICIEEAISRLTDYQGACERIRNTVFPAHYSYFTMVFLWVFLFLLGLSLPVHADVGYFAVPAVFVIGWIFFLIEGIGDYMQDPFEDNRNSTPMFTLARMLEIDLKEILGEADLPPRLQPQEGVLM